MKLFLAPHNDDEVLFGTYTLLRERPLVIVCLRSARMGTRGYPEPLVQAETREEETEAAMDVLGIEWSQWPYLDSAPDWDAIAKHMASMRRNWGEPLHAFAPAIEEDGHEQHSRIGELADEVFGEGNVTHYLTYTSSTVRSKNGRPVSYEPEWPNLKRQALACYRSQIEHRMTGHHFSASLDEFYAL